MGLRCTAIFATDGQREVLLPIALNRSGMGVTSLRSMLWGTYGGPLTEGEPCEPAATPLLEYLRRKSGFGWCVVTPGPWPHLSLGRRLAVYSTQILELGAGLDRLWKGLEKETRNQVRQAERAGVEVGVDMSSAGVDDYFSMLQASADRWGRKDPGKPRALFDAIRRIAGQDQARLWLARLGTVPAAGALCFYGKGEVFYWSGAMHKEHARSRANNLIQWRIIQHAVEGGFRLYNMGSSGELEGVRRFKAGFGSQPRDYPAYFIGVGPFKLAPAALRIRSRLGR
jgi:lipid II:glycine glycyltransferase (peptidoglycan interpeptide bridge formation enzyme)